MASRTAQEASKTTAKSSSGRIGGSPTLPFGTFNETTWAGRNRGITDPKAKLTGYNDYLKGRVDIGALSDSDRIALIANSDFAKNSSTNINTAYDNWLEVVGYPDTEQARQEFSSIKNNYSWMKGRMAAIDASNKATLMKGARDMKNTKQKDKKDLARFGFK